VADNTYEAIASEYYDPNLHPNSRGLGVGSRIACLRLAQSIPKHFKLVIEIGPGREPLSDLFESEGRIYVDSSPTMLAFSSDRPDTTKTIGRADTMLAPDSCADLILAGLGDPYNDAGFWKEAARKLKSTGLCIFTTPSYEWALTYRTVERSLPDTARFVRSDRKVINLPSFIFSAAQQSEIIEASGLIVTRIESVLLSELNAIEAPKLGVVDKHVPVVTGYLVKKSL